MAFDVYGGGEGGDVAGGGFDEYAKDGGVAAETLGADAEGIYVFVQILFHLGVEWVGIGRA